MSSPLGDYMNRYLLPGKPGSSVVLGKELTLFACEGEECSWCFFAERWGCSCVTEVFTWKYGMTQNCHQDKNFLQTKQKTSWWSKIPTEIIYRKLLSVARWESSSHNHKVSGLQSKRWSFKKKKNLQIFFSFPIIPINMVMGYGHFGVRHNPCIACNWAKYGVF